MFLQKVLLIRNNFYYQNIRWVSSANGNEATIKILRDHFGITWCKALSVSKRVRRNIIDANQLTENLNMCRSWNFKNEELLKYPNLFTMCSLQLEQRYLYLKECGFVNITPTKLAYFRKIQRQKIKTLKHNEHISNNLNMVENLLSYLKPQPTIDFSDLNDNIELCNLHTAIVKRYLTWRLETDSDEIERVFRIYKMIINKSLEFLCQNIALAEDLGFTKEKILKYGYLLHNYPKYPKTMLEEFPNFAGTDLRKAMRMYPKLTMVSPKKFLQVYGILKAFKIPDVAIQKSMNIFTLSPETIKFRLETIYNQPSLRVLFSNPKILRLVIHHSRATSRLSYLQQLELKCTSLMFLESDTNTSLEAHVREGHDVNLLQEVVLFLKSLLNSPADMLKTKLRKHPFHLHVPMMRMEETFNYLMSLHFSKSSVFKVVQILLYPKEHIEKAFHEVNSNGNKNVTLSQVQKLNLLLYYMEREHHFTGNGVWLKNDEKHLDPS